MASTNYQVNGNVRMIQIYAPEANVLGELRDNRGAWKIGDAETDVLTYIDLKNFRIRASNWVNNRIRTKVHADNIPVGYPIPSELEDAAVSISLYLCHHRVIAANRAEGTGDFLEAFITEAEGHIDSFIDNLDTYPELIGTGKQITSTPTIVTDEDILFGYKGIEGVEGGLSEDGYEDEPALQNGFDYIDRIN